MPRSIPATLAAHLAQSSTTTCNLLKITPATAPVFGITTLDADVTYDDGIGPLTYYAATGYTSTDIDTKSDISVDSAEAGGLLAQYPLTGVTPAGVAAGDYDSARFVQYIVNYNDLTMGHCIINAGQIGQITSTDQIACQIELRSFTQILKQQSILEITSITCTANFGDVRCKVPLRWYGSSIGTVGDEADRTFICATTPGSGAAPGPVTAPVTGVYLGTGDGIRRLFQLVDTAGEPVTTGFTVADVKKDNVVATNYVMDAGGVVDFAAGTNTPPNAPPAVGVRITWDGTVPLHPDGFFVPGVVHWTSGANIGRENEVESYIAATGAVTLVIPTLSDMVAGDTFNIRRDCDKSKTSCKAYGNILNMRAQPELPRADGTGLQAPQATAG